jgi:AcrR family transcriptional regulator
MAEKRKYEMKKRAERQRETRRRIVEATVELHRTHGPANTTISEIAQRAGVNRLTVYNHFPDALGTDQRPASEVADGID